MTNNHIDDAHIHGNIGKLVQIGKVEGGVTIQDTLETYACCPVCNRNDEVKKVSAIVANQTQSMQGITIEKSSYKDKDGNWHTSTERVPFSGTQASVLAMKLKPPTQPQATGQPGCAWWVGLFLVIIFAFESFGMGIFQFGQWMNYLTGDYYIIDRQIDPNRMYNNEISAFVSGLGYFLGSMFFIFCFVLLYKKYKKKRDEYNLAVIRVQSQEYPKWQKAVERWKKLYYCFRDDCVFIPGENTYAETGSINEYVYLAT